MMRATTPVKPTIEHYESAARISKRVERLLGPGEGQKQAWANFVHTNLAPGGRWNMPLLVDAAQHEFLDTNGQRVCCAFTVFNVVPVLLMSVVLVIAALALVALLVAMVQSSVSTIVAPANLNNWQAEIRERTGRLLDSLPRNEPFDWVDKVSIELTTCMLATLFDFPFEDRRLLTWWSDVATMNKATNPEALEPAERMAELGKMLGYFTKLWNERVNAPPKTDLVSMLAHGAATVAHHLAKARHWPPRHPAAAGGPVLQAHGRAQLQQRCCTASAIQGLPVRATARYQVLSARREPRQRGPESAG